MKKNTYIFILFICFLHAQPKKHYTYRLDSSSDVSEKLLKLLQIQEYQELEYLDITIIGDQKKIKDGDIFNFVFKNSPDDFDKINLSYTVDQKQEKSRWLPIINKFSPEKFGKNIQKNINIDEKDILMSPDITLNLTYNSLTDQVQIHGDQAPNISKSLRKNEKEFVDQPKYIKSEIKETKVYYTEKISEGDDIGGEAITLRDIDLDGEKSKVLRTNLEVTRFFYQSKDSLFAQEVKVTDLRNNKKKKYKIWQSSSDVIIPDQLEKNGIRPGDMKDLEITNYDNPEFPDIKEISYKPYPSLRLSPNIYEFRKKHKLVKAYYFKPRLLNNLPSRKPAWVLVDNKISTKFVYLLEEEYEFKENDENEVVFAPLDDGGKTTVKTLGDIQRHWVPVITSFIVILGLL